MVNSFMTQEDIDAYVIAQNLTPIDPADGGEVNTFKSSPVNESTPTGDISVVTLYGFIVGDENIYMQKYRDAPQNFTECMRMLKANMSQAQDGSPD